MKRALLLALLVVVVLPSGAEGIVPAGPSCTYDAATRTATLDLRVVETPPSNNEWRAGWLGRFRDNLGGGLFWHAWGTYGPDLFDQHCGGATVGNTDVVDVIGNAGEDSFTISQVDHEAQPAPFAGSGIVFDLDLDGPAGGVPDRLYANGTAQTDSIVIGTAGVALDLAGTFISFGSSVELVHVSAGKRGDTVSGQGGNGTGAPTSVRLDVHGGGGNDALRGGLARDLLYGEGGHDTVTGEAGPDYLSGKGGDDTFYARDGEADTVDGGKGADKAEVDTGLDTVKNVETFL